jgi:osmoprotectant transport system substrate-binding protein/osmoprotectant transport system permease protein
MSPASLLLLLAVQAAPDSRPVVVASKPFGESYILAEMFAQLLEARGVEVDRRPGLGATEIAFRAIRAGSADVYPEYTGTGLLAILGEQPVPDPRQVFDRVSQEFRRRWNARWLPPLGFENTYAIAVRRETAGRHRLATLSDLARVSRSLRAGLTADFIGRPDGLPGLSRAYGLRFAEVRALLPAVKYQALAAGEVDVIDGYSTDGLIARYDLVVLRDDKRFFPPYEAAALVSGGLVERRPAAIAALTELSSRLDEAMMRRLNRRLEVDREPVGRIARDALAALGLTAVRETAAIPEPRREESLPGYLWTRRASLLRMTARHLLLVALSLAAAIAVAVPVGLALERLPHGAETAVRGVGLLQTLPGIALLAFMIPLVGIGVLPAVIALFLYSLYPILRNTYTGVRDSAPEAVAAGEALGMTPRQILRHIRLPLAAPVIMAGIRTAAVINVGTATLAAFIGAGGLGDPIAAGLALSDTRMILSGAIPAALLALGVDGALGVVERWVRPA